MVADQQLFDFARTYHLSVLAYSVLLSGSYCRSDREIPHEYRGSDTETRLALLRSVASEVDATPHQVVIASLLRGAEAVIWIIVGSTREHILENVAAAELSLTTEQMNRLTKV